MLFCLVVEVIKLRSNTRALGSKVIDYIVLSTIIDEESVA